MKSRNAESLRGEIVEKALGARDEVELKQSLLESLQPWVPFDYCVWTPLTHLEVGTTVHAGAREAVSQAGARLNGNRARYYDRDFVSRLVASGGIGTDAELATAAERERHPMYTEVFRPAGFRSVFFCTLHFQGRPLSGITLGRRDRIAPFGGRDVNGYRAIRGALGLVEAAFLSGESARIARASESAVPELSRREAQVAALVVKGLQNKEIAALLGTSPATVQKQTISIYRKVGVSGRVQLAARFACVRGSARK
jgi:DNA-binding CsgD family transcriptional regulator